jgi:nitrate/TMAO reductase-like tetraheme cytochrome c subunit
MNIPVLLSAALTIVLTAALTAVSGGLAQAQTAAKLKTDEELMREQMVSMSKQLGVTCTSCHNAENFKSDKKIEFKVAKEHMKLTQLLIDAGMNGQNKAPKASCYMCHRGELHPAYQMPHSDQPKK